MEAETPEFSGYLLATSGPYTERMFTAGPNGGLIGRSRKCKISLLHDCEVDETMPMRHSRCSWQHHLIHQPRLGRPDAV